MRLICDRIAQIQRGKNPHFMEAMETVISIGICFLGVQVIPRNLVLCGGCQEKKCGIPLTIWLPKN